jgi:hypothetical protein
MSKLTKEYIRLVKEARNMKGKNYPINPEGKHIARAKGRLILIKE